MRKCSKRKKDKPSTDFQSWKGNPSGQCRACKTLCEETRRRKNGIKKAKRSMVIGNSKLCMNCNEMKDFSEFSLSKRGSFGLSSYCKSCVLIRFKDTNRNTAAVQKYRAKNRERYLSDHRVHQFNRKNAIKAKCDGSVNDIFLKSLYSTNVCYYCNAQVKREDRTLDHKMPLSKGGLHSINNAVMACFSCNSSKGSKNEIEFKEIQKCRLKQK